MSERTIQDEIEILEMCMPLYESEGSIWFRRNHNMADGSFTDWGAARAFARAATELPKLVAEIEALRLQLARARELLEGARDQLEGSEYNSDVRMASTINGWLFEQADEKTP